MNGSQRLPALDALRGLAVLLMALYHAAFDLRFFYGWPIDVFHGKWLILARTAAILFLLIAGICFALSWESTPPPRRLRKIARRFLILALAAALVSLATWLIAPQGFVKFGILHLFALATLLLPLFAPLKRWNAPLGLLIIFIPHYQLQTTNYPFDKLRVIDKLLMLIGFPYSGFSSLDYFPLIPWFGVILIGLALGHSPYFRQSLQRNQDARAQTDAASESAIGKVSAVWQSVGRHSLMIYLLHQPILLSIMTILLGPP